MIPTSSTPSASTGAAVRPINKLWDVLVIGGGLSGVLVARGLDHFNNAQQTALNSKTSVPASARPIEWKLLEARSDFGGRLANDVGKTNQIDLGGAWIWPHHQPRVRQLVKELQIPTFPQPDDASSTRVQGGAVELVRRVVQDLPQSRLQRNAPIVSCTLENVVPATGESEDDSSLKNTTTPEKVIRLETATNETLHARRVVFAVPPKLLDKHVTFDPALPLQKQRAMANAHTWMAGVTKVALIYKQRFWQSHFSNLGLPRSSSAAQVVEPAFQVYDASTRDGSVHALTFFTLVPPKSEAAADDATLARAVAQQITRVWTSFGLPRDMAQHAVDDLEGFAVQRWPAAKYISEDDQPTTIHPHPHPVPELSQPAWGREGGLLVNNDNNNDNGRNDEGMLYFAGSETDLQSPGVMEGAVGASQRVLESLQAFLTSASQEQPIAQESVAACNAVNNVAVEQQPAVQ